jgi:hypothetical protein
MMCDFHNITEISIVKLIKWQPITGTYWKIPKCFLLSFILVLSPQIFTV